MELHSVHIDGCSYRFAVEFWTRKESNRGVCSRSGRGEPGGNLPASPCESSRGHCKKATARRTGQHVAAADDGRDRMGSAPKRDVSDNSILRNKLSVHRLPGGQEARTCMSSIIDPPLCSSQIQVDWGEFILTQATLGPICLVWIKTRYYFSWSILILISLSFHIGMVPIEHFEINSGHLGINPSHYTPIQVEQRTTERGLSKLCWKKVFYEGCTVYNEIKVEEFKEAEATKQGLSCLCSSTV